MDAFVEPFPELVTPAGADDPLGEGVRDPRHRGLRVYEPQRTCVVIGRAQDPYRELQVAACAADGVPVHRRCTGGGAVVLAPGMVVVALRLAGGLHPSSQWFSLINPALSAAVRAAGGPPLTTQGHGDLAVIEEVGRPRKVLGASLRQGRLCTLYLGVFLVADAAHLMERYLAHPSREPAYRQGRRHRDFCTALDRYGVRVAELIGRLEQGLAALIDQAP
ncbi:MAG: hypothetical protein RMM29_07175 [Planctomycetota bacterium]|nr:hypothetical protein [Planctomycetota bacterium]